jgi:hypothetical protein
LACFRKLAYVLKPKGAKGVVTKVELQVDGITVAFMEKSDVERETKRRNKAHFNQPAGFPFTVFPLSELGTTATKFKTNILPNGQLVEIPSDTFLETNTLLDLLKQPLPGAKFAQISSRIMVTDFTTAIKVWSKKTSTSPSGRHLGHYKIIVQTYEDPNTLPATREAAEDILKLIVKIWTLQAIKDLPSNDGQK